MSSGYCLKTQSIQYSTVEDAKPYDYVELWKTRPAADQFDITLASGFFKLLRSSSKLHKYLNTDCGWGKPKGKEMDPLQILMMRLSKTYTLVQHIIRRKQAGIDK